MRRLGGDAAGLHVIEQPLFIPAELHLELGAHAYLSEHAVEH